MQFFRTLCRVWAAAHPDAHPLEEGAVQMHKDYAPPAQKNKKLESKLSELEWQGGGYVKAAMGFTTGSLHGLHGLRHLATIDLYSLLWGGALERLMHMKEPVATEHLGTEGSETYTMRRTVGVLREEYNIRAHTQGDDEVLLFSPHWAGIGGIVRGTDCGDEPQEAFHSPSQLQLDPWRPSRGDASVGGDGQALREMGCAAAVGQFAAVVLPSTRKRSVPSQRQASPECGALPRHGFPRCVRHSQMLPHP